MLCSCCNFFFWFFQTNLATKKRSSDYATSAVLRSFFRDEANKLGAAERCTHLQEGVSFILAINGESTLDKTFDETHDMLDRADRPLVLRFTVRDD